MDQSAATAAVDRWQQRSRRIWQRLWCDKQVHRESLFPLILIDTLVAKDVHTAVDATSVKVAILGALPTPGVDVGPVR